MREVRLEAALLKGEAEAAGALRKLRGEPEPAAAALLHRGSPPPKKQRLSGTWQPGLAPTGAEWFFARWCARQCLHLWDAPEIVRQYIETEDPELARLSRSEELRAEWTGAQPRGTAVDAANWWRPPEAGGLVPWDPGRDAARAAAACAASGNIHGAVQKAIEALAWDARRQARAVSEDVADLQAAFDAARGALQIRFAETAREIYGGELNA